MATRSTIAIENLDGTVSMVYSHWDGYIGHNGAILNKYYDTREKVMSLINNGDISSLARYVSEDDIGFERNEHDYTIFYKYRGEVCPARQFESFDDYDKNHQTEEYEYFFSKDGVWSVLPYGKDWVDLEYVIQELQIEDPYEVKE